MFTLPPLPYADNALDHFRWLEAQGVECIACDLLDREALETLPRLPNLVFMAGHKFGATGNASLTWMMNVGVPMRVAPPGPGTLQARSVESLYVMFASRVR